MSDDNLYSVTLTRDNANIGILAIQEYLVSLQSERSRKTMVYCLNIAMSALNTTVEEFNWGGLKDSLVAAIVTRLTQDYAPASVNIILVALKAVARRLWAHDVISTRDYELIKKVKGARGSRVHKGRALNEAELNELFEELDSYASSKAIRDRAIISCLLGCGLRRAEIAELQFDNVHLNEDDPYLTIIGKGNKERKCYIPDETVERLKEWFFIRKDTPGACFSLVDKHDNVLEKKLTPYRIYRITQDWANKINMKRWTPHDLRRTYASNLLGMGVDINTVKNMMGHASITTTQIYDRRGDDSMRKAVHLMNRKAG